MRNNEYFDVHAFWIHLLKNGSYVTRNGNLDQKAQNLVQNGVFGHFLDFGWSDSSDIAYSIAINDTYLQW